MRIPITLEPAADGGTERRAIHENIPPGVRSSEHELGRRLSLEKLAARVERGRGDGR